MQRRKLRPVPANLKRMRYGVTDSQRWYARFYGNYDSMTGKLRRYSYQVKITPTLQRDRRRLGALIRATVHELHDAVPEHVQGEVFSSFGELFRANWVRIRRLRNYEAGVVYGR